MSSRNAETADGAVRRPAPPVLRLYLLGGFRTERTDGAPVADRWPRPSSRRLVELLAVSPGRVRHREEIIEMCWPDTAGTPAALGSLRVALHAARRALEPELTARTPSSYLIGEGALLRLAPDTVWIDADEAETLAERALRTGTTAHLAAALEAFTGELLPEHRYTPWVEARRERLDALRDSVRLTLAEAYLADGETERAAATARRILADSAAEERAHRVLIGAYLRQGMRRRALAQYHQCRRALDAEWGIRPGPETEALHRAALGTSTTVVRRPAPAAPTPPPAVIDTLAASPFVGRRTELERLLDPTRPALSVIGGEAGIGKTRLAAEAARRAAADGTAVLWGASHDTAEQAPYGLFVEALEGWLAGRPAAERARAGAEYPELAALLPSLGQIGPAPGRGGGPEYERERIFAAVSGLLASAAAPGGVLVVLDDVHTADTASLHLLSRLTRRTQGSAEVRFLATYRPEDLPEPDPRRTLLDSLVRQGAAHRLRLPRLDRTDCLTLAADAMSGGGDGDSTTLERVWELSLGHPLFAVELAKATSGMSGYEDLTPPEGVRLLVADRLSRLSPAACQVIEAVAMACGGVAALTEVQEVAGATAEVADGIDAALAAAVLEERALPTDGRTVPGLGFRHPLIRLVCRERLSVARRRRLHAAYAELLLRRRPGAVDAVAAHLTGADDPRAADHLHLAARRAAAVGADDTADHYYGELTARLDAVAVEAARIRLDHAAVLRRMARHEDAARVLREALTDLRRHGSAEEQVRVAAQLAETLARTGEAQEGFRLLDAYRPSEEMSAETVAAHWMARGVLCFVTGDYEGSLGAARTAEQSAGEYDAPRGAGLYRLAAPPRGATSHNALAPADGENTPHGLRARALALQSTSLALAGRLPQARATADAALPHAEAHGDPRLLARVLSILREHARRSGRLREAAAIGRRALDLADGCGDPEAAAFERANLAEVHLLLGEFEAAAELAADAVAEAQAHSGWCLPYALAALARVQLRGGPRPALPDPRELLTRAAHCVSRRPDHQADYEVRTAQAELALRDVRPDRALALLETVSGTGVPVIAAWAHLTAGDPARAARLAAEEAVRAAGSGEAVTECEARTAQATALAVLGRTDEAGRCAARVRELATALPYPTVLRRVSHANPS
ncbi:AAA family ATPase [Streptomyces sp. NBC_00124]|uniref:AAA family ATPase n=1 Tax=Streptomyces sp. NBC_00124 TaxID=2975662 RepID=UPI002255FBC4|nr:AAA family ATPase [Streptomyces sp. NBC_00124]MCX5362123.1 AAA family ATPase [Streptomyces sp. NBC_00124]